MEELNINFRRILLFSLILFLSLSVVSAEEVNNSLDNTTTTLSSDEEITAFEDTIEYSDEYYDYDYEFEEYDDFEEEYTENELHTDELLIEDMDSIDEIKPVNQVNDLNGNNCAVSFSLSKGNSVVMGMHEAIQEYSILNAIQTMSQTCMDTAHDLIISTGIKKNNRKSHGMGCELI